MIRHLAKRSVRLGLLVLALPLLAAGLYFAFLGGSDDWAVGYLLLGAAGLLSGLSGLGSVLAGGKPPGPGSDAIAGHRP